MSYQVVSRTVQFLDSFYAGCSCLLTFVESSPSSALVQCMEYCSSCARSAHLLTTHNDSAHETGVPIVNIAGARELLGCGDLCVYLPNHYTLAKKSAKSVEGTAGEGWELEAPDPGVAGGG